jgi:hypothetical protein
MAVMRVWRHLAERRRSGQDHGIDLEFPHRQQGSLAVRCPACPEPGFNVNLGELRNAPTSQMYVIFRAFTM